MSEIKDVRAALERLKPPPIEPGTLHHDVIAAFVSEGLAACDYAEKYEESILNRPIAIVKISAFASILKKAGLL